MSFRFLPLYAAGAIILKALLSREVHASSTWPNEPNGFQTKTDCPFDNISACGIKDVYSAATIQTDGSALISPSSVMRSRIEANSSSGGVQVEYSLGGLYRELYVGMMWRTNAGFVTNPTAANKMWFMRGPNTNGFFGLNLGSGASMGSIYFGHNTGGLDNSHTCSADLGLICNPNGASSPVVIGQWTKLEAYIKSSTTATSRDGIVRWWVNGILVGNYPDMNYPGGLNEWIWTETWGGPSVNIPYVREHFIDHLYISVPGDGSTPTPAPAPAPIPAPVPAPAPAPAPQPVPGIGGVNDFAFVSATLNSITLGFTEINDGTGAPAKYDLRYGPVGSNWGSMTSVSSGNCIVPIEGSQIGAKKSCTISGLASGTQYQFQIVPYRGTPNQGAIYGGFSALVNATTQTASPSPAPAPAPVPAPQPAPIPIPGPGDRVGPQVSFVYPKAEATISGSVVLLAQASDNVGVTELRFYLNGVQLGSELRQAPYTMVVDTTQIQDGNHELSVVAKDAAGNMSVPSRIRINVTNLGATGGSNPATSSAGCIQTKTNQVNASMGLVWVLPIFGLIRRRRK